MDDLGWYWSDPVCSFVIAVLTLISVYPLLMSSGHTLLQRVPKSMENTLNQVHGQMMSIPGVMSLIQTHLWELCHDQLVGTIRVLVARDSDEQTMRLQISNLFKQAGVGNMTVQIEKEVVYGY